MNTYNAIVERIQSGRAQTQAMIASDPPAVVTFPLTNEPNQDEIDAAQTAILLETVAARRRGGAA